MKRASAARRVDQRFELRCELLDALLRSQDPLTEEEAAARFGVSVREIGDLLDAVRRDGWIALVVERRRRRAKP